jgi:BirA family biotin operon repressor/biotin-[acetyl-CoA-carboxylase] ligase
LIFDTGLVESSLRTRWAGQRLIYLNSCDSTHDEARRLQPAQRPVGTLLLAETQTAGRGRWGRSWQSPAGRSLLMTLILPEPAGEVTAARLGVAVGVGLARACRQAGVQAKIKWPNDLMAGGKKLAGLLMESLPLGLAVGIGLNVNQAPADFGGGLEQTATSLAIQAGKPVSREPLLAGLLQQVELACDSLAEQGFEGLKKQWHSMAMYLGEPVRVKTTLLDTHSVEGTLLGLDSDGALLLRQDHGLVLPVAAGDLLNLRPVLT